MPRRAWERDLEDPRSTLSHFERTRAAERAANFECINVSAFVRECLDGVVGDIDLPASYSYAPFDESTPDGFSDAQRPVYRQIEAAIVSRTRPLTTIERERLGLAFVLEWNRRVELQDDRARRAEWLADYQAGLHDARGAA